MIERAMEDTFIFSTVVACHGGSFVLNRTKEKKLKSQIMLLLPHLALPMAVPWHKEFTASPPLEFS